MTDVTDADRERAMDVLGYGTEWPYRKLSTEQRGSADDIAAALAEERGKALASIGAVGRCGVESPSMGSLGTNVCALPAGHAGWHQEGTTEWGIRRAAEEQQQ